MKWMFGRTAMWLWATFAAATVAFAAGQAAHLPEGEGKKILEDACTSCHSLDGTVGLKLGKEGWEGLVSSMISNGAQVSTKDYPVLIDYLVKNFGPNAGQTASAQSNSKDADAKKILEEACTSCHDTDLVTSLKLSKNDWQIVVDSMVAKGASMADKDVPVLVEYLTANYGAQR